MGARGLATRHRLMSVTRGQSSCPHGVSPLQAQGLEEGDEHPPTLSFGAWLILPLSLPQGQRGPIYAHTI